MMNFYKKLQLTTTFLIVVSLLGVDALFAQQNNNQRESFWQDVDFELDLGISGFAGDFDNFGNVVDYTPFPLNGFAFGMYLSKPFGNLTGLTPSVRLGFAGMSYNSSIEFRPSVVDPALASGGLAPSNVKNFIIGPEIGATMDIHVFNSLRVAPMLSLGVYYNDPRADRFFNSDGFLVSPNVDTNRLSRDFSMSDVPEALAAGEEIPDWITALNFGARVSFKIAGTDYYLMYNIRRFMNDYFDGVRDISREQGPNVAANLSVGVRLPVMRGLRERDLGRDFSSQLEYVRGNMDYENREQRESFFDTFGEIALDKETPGLNINHMAAKVEFLERPLGNSNYMIEVSRIPGSTFVIGNMNEDEFQIQNYGRVRVSVQDFIMSRKSITNKEYKIFLAAMGYDFDGSERYQRYVTGEGMGFSEIMETAGLAGESLPGDISLNGVDDLVPDSESWNRMNLGNILSFEDYFYMAEFDNFPVVSVNWYQAKLFAAWAGFRLPNEVEWEYAAKGAIGGRVFPWDGYLGTDADGNYLANYMQERGVYNLDGYTLMAPVDTFRPNDFGLYNMAGNVSEWVADSYSSTYQTLQRGGLMVTPNNIDLTEPRKVHRGGSWASSLFFIGSGVRNYHSGHYASPTIGFRIATNRGMRVIDGMEEAPVIDVEDMPEQMQPDADMDEEPDFFDFDDDEVDIEPIEEEEEEENGEDI